MYLLPLFPRFFFFLLHRLIYLRICLFPANYVGIQNERVHEIDRQTITPHHHGNSNLTIVGLPSHQTCFKAEMSVLSSGHIPGLQGFDRAKQSFEDGLIGLQIKKLKKRVRRRSEEKKKQEKKKMMEKKKKRKKVNG